MSGIRTNAAAVMLGVSTNTLRSWERRGTEFPRPRRTPRRPPPVRADGDRIASATLAETHNVSSAIAPARQRGEGPSSGSRLAAAFATFDEDKANGLLEESLRLLARSSGRSKSCCSKGLARTPTRRPRAVRPSTSSAGATPPRGCPLSSGWPRRRRAPRACWCSTPPCRSKLDALYAQSLGVR